MKAHSSRATSADEEPSAPSPVPAMYSYWILNRWGGRSAAIAARYKVSVKENPFPHEGLTSFGYNTPQELMKSLVAGGWKRSSFTNSTDQFAKVQVVADGFNVTCFPSYAAALSEQRAVEKPAKATKSAVSCCPFCGMGDMLQKISWTHEREDGSEYQGPAIQCHRCSAIVPLPAWRLLGKQTLKQA